MNDALFRHELLAKFISVNVLREEREGSRVYDIGYTDM